MIGRVLLAAGLLATATPALAGPEAYRMGQQMCAKLAQHYGLQYPKYAALPDAEREQVFEDVKTRQATQRMEDAAAGRDSTATFVNSMTAFVERTMVLIALDEPDLSVAQVQGRLFDQCSVQARPLLGLPGR